MEQVLKDSADIEPDQAKDLKLKFLSIEMAHKDDVIDNDQINKQINQSISSKQGSSHGQDDDGDGNEDVDAEVEVINENKKN